MFFSIQILGYILIDGKLSFSLGQLPPYPEMPLISANQTVGNGTIFFRVLQRQSNFTIVGYKHISEIMDIGVQIEIDFSRDNSLQDCQTEGYVPIYSDTTMFLSYEVSSCTNNVNIPLLVGLIVGGCILIFVIIAVVASRVEFVRNYIFPFRDVVPDYNLS